MKEETFDEMKKEYDEAIEELSELETKKDRVINEYIDELEEHKIAELKALLNKSNTH